MTRTVLLGPGIVTITDATGKALANGVGAGLIVETTDGLSSISISMRHGQTAMDELREVSGNLYTRMEDKRLQEIREQRRKRPAWKTPYGPQRR